MRKRLFRRILSLSLTGWLSLSCSKAPPEPELKESTRIFLCAETLIGLETASCREDVVGPGTLTLSIRPDPKQTSWELTIRGMVALADTCAFEGEFDGTRLSRLQGRGVAKIVCPIAASVDRQYHEIRFESRVNAPNTAIHLELTFDR